MCSPRRRALPVWSSSMCSSRRRTCSARRRALPAEQQHVLSTAPNVLSLPCGAAAAAAARAAVEEPERAVHAWEDRISSGRPCMHASSRPAPSLARSALTRTRCGTPQHQQVAGPGVWNEQSRRNRMSQSTPTLDLHPRRWLNCQYRTASPHATLRSPHTPSGFFEAF